MQPTDAPSDDDKALAERFRQGPDAPPQETTRTPEERRALYDAIPAGALVSAMELIAASVPPEVAAEVRSAYEADPDGWWRSPDLRLVGISVRNLLRSRGFDAEYFRVGNLDDIYVLLVEDALKLR